MVGITRGRSLPCAVGSARNLHPDWFAAMGAAYFLSAHFVSCLCGSKARHVSAGAASREVVRLAYPSPELTNPLRE